MSITTRFSKAWQVKGAGVADDRGVALVTGVKVMAGARIGVVVCWGVDFCPWTVAAIPVATFLVCFS